MAILMDNTIINTLQKQKDKLKQISIIRLSFQKKGYLF